MLPLRFRRLWATGATVIAAGIATFSLLPAPLVAQISLYDKLGHAAAYFLLTGWLTGMYERERYPLAIVLALLLGVCLELAQTALTSTRQLEFLDFVANAAGIALAGVLAYGGLGGWATRVERWLGAPPAR